jgi:hypothetical protein
MQHCTSIDISEILEHSSFFVKVMEYNYMGMARNLYLIFGFSNTLKYGNFLLSVNEIICKFRYLVVFITR